MKKNRLAKNSMAVGLVTLIVTAGLSFSAQAAPAYKTYAKASFLSGSLDGLANTGTAVADNDGSQAQVKAENAATLTALDSIDIPVLNLGLGQALGADSINSGVISQYAEANNSGKARAAAGAVSDTGGADLDEATNGFPKAATVDLGNLLDGAAADLVDGNLTIGAVTAVADQSTPTNATLAGTCANIEDPEQCRDYNIAGLGLNLDIPAVKDLSDALSPVLTSTLGDVDGLSLADDICAPLSLGVVCDTLGLGLDINTPALNTLLDDVTNLTSDGVTVNLNTGSVTVDIQEFLNSNQGIDLNNISPTTGGTEILNQVVAALPGVIGDLVQTAIFGDGTPAHPGVVNRILSGTSISLEALGLTVLDLDATQLQTVLNPLLTQLTTGLNGLTDTLGNTLSEVVTALNGVVALNVNRQYSDGVHLIENAVQLRLLGNVVVDLSTAAVRPAGEVTAADDDDDQAAAADDDDQAAAADDDDQAAVDDGNSVVDADSADADADADADVARTLPDTGAPNLLPLWIMGLAFVMFGGAILLNEKRRKLLS